MKNTRILGSIFYLFILSTVLIVNSSLADDGYDLWMKYKKITDEKRAAEYRRQVSSVLLTDTTDTRRIIKAELENGLGGLLGKNVSFVSTLHGQHLLVVGTPKRSEVVRKLCDGKCLESLGKEGYLLKTAEFGGSKVLVIAANENVGLLYGAFHLLRLIQTLQPLDSINIVSIPKTEYRLLDHWDNLDGSIERGYAGKSLWKWNELPNHLDPRYRDYARAASSIGINGTVLNNVNADPRIIDKEHLVKIKALADLFRPYGLRVFLSVNFASPMGGKFEQEGNRAGGIGKLTTADPLDQNVRLWWKNKVREIYSIIPDFGGFLVKANSEGMPGPQDFGRTHLDGANMLAEALQPYGGIVMWRAFVYNPDVDADRVKRAYKEFVPFDGKFLPNVFVQAKNGPLDFQPREPVQALFGAMPKTPLMLELQITQEYLGHSTHLVYLAPMWKEYLQFDLYAKGPGSTLASVVDGTLQHYQMTGMAGVTNIGDDRNWCGHLFAQANWYAFGRLAWDHSLSAEQIANEWIRMTLTNDSSVVASIRTMMMGSREACVDYMEPLGLHHIMQTDFHYGPEPSYGKGRLDWSPVYYHRADSVGIGFDRSSSGSNASGQYFSPLKEMFDDTAACPEKYLLWFHHVRWDHRMRSGRTLWDELCVKYYSGTAYVDSMLTTWNSLQQYIDPEIFQHVKSKLEKQKVDAGIWRDTCLKYFQQFSKRPILQSP